MVSHSGGGDWDQRFLCASSAGSAHTGRTNGPIRGQHQADGSGSNWNQSCANENENDKEGKERLEQADERKTLRNDAVSTEYVDANVSVASLSRLKPTLAKRTLADHRFHLIRSFPAFPWRLRILPRFGLKQRIRVLLSCLCCRGRRGGGSFLGVNLI